jgi:hypothetical protein
MGKWFPPNAVRLDLGLEGIKRSLIRFLLRLTNIIGITSKSKRVKYPDLSFAVRPVQHSGEFPVIKPSENLTFSDDNSDSDEDYGQQEGENVDCDPIFEASSFSSEPHLTQGNLNDFVRDLSLSYNKLYCQVLD